jgi:hypothetical protein
VARKGFWTGPEPFRRSRPPATLVVVVEDFESKDNTTTSAQLRQEFAQLLAPLERRSGSRLGNPARRECFAAFSKYRSAVTEVARSTLAEAERNPVGLFVYRIRNGYHLLEPLADALAEPSPAVDSDSKPQCPHCDVTLSGPRTLAEHLFNVHDEEAA